MVQLTLIFTHIFKTSSCGFISFELSYLICADTFKVCLFETLLGPKSTQFLSHFPVLFCWKVPEKRTEKFKIVLRLLPIRRSRTTGSGTEGSTLVEGWSW